MPHRPLGSDPTIQRKVVHEADRLLRGEAARFGDDVRELRLRRGLTQADVARAIGVSRSVVSRIESGRTGASLKVRCRMVVALGSRLRLPVYADGTPLLHDALHARIVERMLRIRDSRWRAQIEAPVPGPGRRSSDIRLEHEHDVVLFEVESHVRRWEEVVRESRSKREAVQAAEPPGVRVHTVLVLPPTRHHRELVATHPETISASFPCSPRDLKAALRDPVRPWPGDGLIWIAGG